MPRRQIQIIHQDSKDGNLEPLGTPGEVSGMLARFNTGPDKDASAGTGGPGVAPPATLLHHGPGLVAEVPMLVDEVTQFIITLRDEDFAFPVVIRMCRALGWAMVDVETGRRFG